MIGTEQVSRARPTATTLLMTANTYLIDAQTRKANYHPVTAFDPICYLVHRRRCSSSTARRLIRLSRTCLTPRGPSPASCRWRRSVRARRFRWGSRR